MRASPRRLATCGKIHPRWFQSARFDDVGRDDAHDFGQVLAFADAPSTLLRRLSSILRIIHMSPNSSRAEKAMDGESHLYRERTRVISRVDPSEFASSCQVHVVSPGVPQIME